MQKNSYIEELRENQKCPHATPACVGSHCYIDPILGIHFPLSHQHFDLWASGIVSRSLFTSHADGYADGPHQIKGPETATLSKPPHHKLFDTTSSISPVLQRRIDAQNSKTSSSTSSGAPVFNISIGKEILDVFRPPVVQPVAPLLPIAPPPPRYHADLPTTLLNPTRLPGDNMTLAELCILFDLSETILTKFIENGYTQARFLRFVTITELEQMGFKMGEIAALRDAVETWSLPGDVV